MEQLRLDALTAAVAAWRLATRSRGAADLAQAMVDAIGRRESADINTFGLGGIRTTIKSMGNGRPAILDGGRVHDATLRIEIDDRGGGRSTIHGVLSRDRNGLVFTTMEIGIDGDTRMLRSHKGPLRLEVRQEFPETLRAAMPSRVGMPLASLVGHEALAMPEAASITIGGIARPRHAPESRVGQPGSGSDIGFDIEITAPEILYGLATR